MNARRLFANFAAAVLCLAAASPALGLSNRVFVSARSGNDANACASILTPCQTLTGAAAQLNPGGEAIVLDSGGYGSLTVTKALTIEAPPGVLAFVHPPAGDGITINAGASDVVVLRGLTLNVGAGNGIVANTVGSLYVENCVINGFNNNGLQFGAAGKLFVKDSIIRNNGNHGIQVGTGTATANVDHCRLEGNGFVSTFGAGIVINDNSKGIVSNTIASGNEVGFNAVTLGASTTAELNLESCVAAGNAFAGLEAGGNPATLGGVIRVSNSASSDNLNGIFTFVGGQVLTRTNNTLEGNGTNGAFTGTFLTK